MKIILIGYMASGKSTIGKLLANIIGFNFIDLDTYIEGEEGKTISEIFSNNGEVYFRKIEHKYLKTLLLSSKRSVISLGGGTPCYANNMDLILRTNDAISIFFRTSVREIVNRLLHEKEERPLVANIESEEALQEFVSKHLFERNPFYNQSDFIIDTDNKSTQKIVEEIIFRLF